MTNAHFSGIEKYILTNLKQAKQDIKVAVAWITNPRLFDALLSQIKAGRKVEVIVADDKMNFSNPHINFQALIDAGGIVRISIYPKLMHHKFCIIDSRILITGSYNWTRNAELNNLENIILSTDLGLINAFEQAFSALKTSTTIVNTVSLVRLHDYTTEQERTQEYGILLDTDTAITSDSTPPPGAMVEEPDVPPEIEEMFQKAELLYLRGKHVEALKIADTILEHQNDIAAVYDLIALIKWRQGNHKEQVSYAEKATLLDNQFYAAYNILGIGYAHLQNVQKSIHNYQICLDHSPEDYVVLLNRAISFIDLENAPSTPNQLRKQFRQKADNDLRHAIELTNKYESEHKENYMLYFVRGSSKLLLGKYILAKTDLLKALDIYNASPITKQDVHIFKDIKQGLKDIEKIGNVV